MRVLIANESKQMVGGGFTFLRNFKKYGERNGMEFLDDFESNGIYFIAGATMITRDNVIRAKQKGMRIVLRVDNVPKNSKNRNTGTSRLKDFADMADLVIYQSKWAHGYLSPWLGKTGSVILNGADHEIFTPDGSKQPKEGRNQYLYAQYNRDETKRWHEAWYHYQRSFRKRPDSHLWIVGNFSKENMEYNFDFFMGEKFRYVGVIEDAADLAEYLRSTDVLLLPYFNDACSNTLIEARLCDVPIIKQSGSGGNQEIMETPVELLTADVMVKNYIREFEKL